MKKLKISYKLYLNDKRALAPFQGGESLPLYFYMHFNRKQNTYKSSLFDLFERSLYRDLGIKMPQLVELETEAINYIIKKHENSFSHDLFYREYKLLGRDLIALMEEAFLDFLINFFMDKGLARYPGILAALKGEMPAYSIMEALSETMKPELLKELLEAAAVYAPPYLPALAFVKSKWPNDPSCLFAFRWDQPDVKADFRSFLLDYSPKYDLENAVDQLDIFARSTP